MLKTIVALVGVGSASTAFASHPHQAVCVVSETQASGETIEFVLQTESAREYVNGNPDKDTRDYRYQVRVCDDDNEGANCSTYESKTLTHAPTDEVTLVGMKDKTAVFFRGHIGPDAMDGKIVQRDGAKRKLVPFSAKLDKCIATSWIKLPRESNSNTR